MVADVRIETAEVVGLTPGAPVRLVLADGRSLSADAVVLATGRPKGGMPESLERAFAPVLEAGTDGKIVVDPWAPGALAALGARRPASVLVIGSGLTGVDVALPLIARGATVTMLSRHGALPRRFRTTGPPTELPNLDGLAAEVSLEQLRAALAADLAHAREAGCDWRQVIDALRPARRGCGGRWAGRTSAGSCERTCGSGTSFATACRRRSPMRFMPR